MKYGALNSIPRQTDIYGVPHELSYINEEEKILLKSLGGMGTPGPGGVPQYNAFTDWISDTAANVTQKVTDTFKEVVSAGTAQTQTYNNTSDGKGVFETISATAEAIFGDKGYFETAADKIIDLDGDSTTTDASVITEPNELELSYDSTKTYAQLEAEAKAAGESMFIFQGNYFSVPDDDDAESIEGITTEFFDAFGNSYATQARATAADKKAEEQSTAAKAGVTVLHTSTGLPYFYDNGGKQHSTLAGAINANETIDLNAALDSGTLEGPFNEQLGLTFTDSRGLFHTSQADADAADSAYAIEDSASTAVSSGSDEVQSYVDQFGTTGLEDRFLTTLINPATGLPYEPTDTNIVNPLDADTIPYSPDGYSDSEIQILGGDPYQTTVDGIVQTDDAFRDPTTEGDGQHGQTFDADDIVDLAVIENGVVVDDGISSDNSLTFKDEDYQRTRDVRGTKDVYGDFIGGKSRGLWDRAPTYITRFGYTPGGIDEMVRVVEQEDGSKLYYGADGALLNPELMEGVRLRGDPTSLKIGEENVLLGTQTLNPDGTVSGTSYTDQYDPETDASLFNYQ